MSGEEWAAGQARVRVGYGGQGDSSHEQTLCGEMIYEGDDMIDGVYDGHDCMDMQLILLLLIREVLG